MATSSDLLLVGLQPTAGGIAEVSIDLTPQLGGDLDLNGNQITSPDGTDLIDVPNGSIDLQTNSVSRVDVTDAGVRFGAANARITTVLDEDTLVTNSATALATQQSIKAYVDTAVAGAGSVDSIPNSGYAAARYYNGITAVNKGGTKALSVDVLYSTPFIVAETHTFDRIAFDVTTAGTATAARLGIYNMAAGVPTTLVLDCGTADVTGTGQKDVTISQSITAGVYALAIVANGTVTVGSNVFQETLLHHFTGATATNISSGRAFTGAHTYGALPASYPAVSYDASSATSFGLRA